MVEKFGRPVTARRFIDSYQPWIARLLGHAVERAFAGGAQGISLFQGDTLTPVHWKEFSAAVKRAGAV